MEHEQAVAEAIEEALAAFVKEWPDDFTEPTRSIVIGNCRTFAGRLLAGGTVVWVTPSGETVTTEQRYGDQRPHVLGPALTDDR